MDPCEQKGKKRVDISGLGDKRQITALLCGSLVVPVQMVYKGKTPRCLPKFSVPLDWDITQAPKHWSTDVTMIRYINDIFIPHVQGAREFLHTPNDAPALIIMDNFKGQVTDSVNKLPEDNNILVCLLPPNTTDQLQPMDISVNKPFKSIIQNKFVQWYSDEIMKQLTDDQDIDATDVSVVDLSLANM